MKDDHEVVTAIDRSKAWAPANPNYVSGKLKASPISIPQPIVFHFTAPGELLEQVLAAIAQAAADPGKLTIEPSADAPIPEGAGIDLSHPAVDVKASPQAAPTSEVYTNDAGERVVHS